jgi:amino acid adenylation domain-containing protein
MTQDSSVSSTDSNILNCWQDPTADLPLLSEMEQQLLQDWAVKPAIYPAHLTLVQCWEQQVERTPSAIALRAICQSSPIQLTYAELNARANQLAHYLDTLGVQPEELVAVSMERSIEMIVAFLGILKVGAAYVPLDPTYPHERRAYKLQDAQVKIILTQNALVESLPPHQARVIRLDEDWATIASESESNLANRTGPDGLAYVLYTSGSTGNPKGVMIQHRGLVNHAMAIAQEFEIKPGDRMLQFSNMGFDIIVEELYPTLLSGATLVLRPEAIASSMQAFGDFVAEQEITLLELPTAFWHEWVNSLDYLDRLVPETVRLVCVGGEKASLTAYQQWRSRVSPQVRWINTYGPTETTVSATWFDPLKASFDPAQGEIPIGTPLPNVEVYVLDDRQHLVPIGMAGELCIGGPGLARGYLNQPEKTKERFIAHPFRPGARLYRTGDQVRFRSDGNLEFVGRMDFQVKIRGFRIELAEIETQLEKHPDIRQAVVLAKEQAGTKYLIAYVVPIQGTTLTTQEMGHWLQVYLPAYMIPSQLVLLESLPLTPNGKVNRQALPEPTISSRDGIEFAPPQDLLEQNLIKLWTEILGQPVGIYDNFFDLGGHSLLVARLCDRIEQQLHQRLSPMVLFQAPTVHQLSQYMRQESTLDMDVSSAVVIQAGSETRLPLFAIHVLGEGGRFFRPLAQYLGIEQPVYGLAAQMLDVENAPRNRVEDLATYYIQEMRLVQPEGPYYLVGMSYGGAIVYEMARQLEQLGLPLGLVALLDTYGPNTEETLPSRDRLLAHWLSWQQQGLDYVGQKVQNIWQSRWEQAQISYGRVAQRWGMRIPYELRYKMILADNSIASDAYVPKSFGGRLALFRATEAVFYSQRYLDDGLGWRDLVGALDIYDVPGTHMSMVEEPQVQSLAKQMQQALAQAPWQKPFASATFGESYAKH